MVLLSGTGKSVLQQITDDKSKAQGVNNSNHHQGNKSVESGRTHGSLNASVIKGMTTMDEFKYGFPSEGLSTTSNKWWGSSKHDDCAGNDPDRAKNQLEERAGEADKVVCETGNAENSETLQGAAKLTAARKRAVEEGRETLKLGVFRGYGGVDKLGKRDKILLCQIFRSSLPKSWIDDL
ncbi:hypothetical protein RIF29_42101 [Crotalaria pallida]|uniref:Uncharacterized protein n=1 Tax=Crotalaria pallida TaxID=3830 RepID=A0AAN9E6Q5_CROPI